MPSIIATLAAAATLAIAPAAIAKSPASGADADQMTLSPSADGKTLCTASFVVTGSLLPQKICRTRAEWLADGARVVRR